MIRQLPQRISTFMFALWLVLAGPAALGQDLPIAIDAKPLVVEAAPSAVTLYLGRAAVTRTAALELAPGLYDLQFSNLPESVQPLTLQARASSASPANPAGAASPGIKVLAVDFMQEAVTTAVSPQIAELDKEIEKLQLSLKEIAEQRELIKAQEDYIAAITARIVTETSKDTGTEKQDTDAMRRHLTFIAEERARLLTERRELDAQQRELDKQLAVLRNKRQSLAAGGANNVNRTAVVTVAATETAQAAIELTYLVGNATWEPAYNVRAAIDGSAALIEYDAMLVQRTGEDWDNVRLTLSTAQPTVAANPPQIQPWFVDIFRPMPARSRSEARVMSPPPGSMEVPRIAQNGAGVGINGEDAQLAEQLQKLSADAQVAGAGPSVTYALPRLVTVKTNVQKQQRTRIAQIDTAPKFIHVAVPLLTNAVYIRGDLTNASAYQLLPGRASIFVGQDYVGPTNMASVAPQGEFKIHFGIDQAVKTNRQLISKKTDSTGLLGGGRRTSYDYRITIENGAGKPITVELWDRYPISRTDEIQIELVDVTPPLANDAKYVAEEKPQGFLKWNLNVPPTPPQPSGGAGSRPAQVVTYGVRVNRAKDVEMTPLPE